MSINSRNGNTMLNGGSFAPARVATIASIALAGLQTIDGVTLLENDRVLVKDQVDQTTNGIYAASTGNWTRASDCASNTQLFLGMKVTVAQGAVNGAQDFICTSTDDPVVIGTSLIVFQSQTAVAASYTVATSTTSLAIGTGTKTFTTQAGRTFTVGRWVLAYSQSNNANQMLGQVTSYSGTTLALNVTATGGSGTVADWALTLLYGPATAGILPPTAFGNTAIGGTLGVTGAATFNDPTAPISLVSIDAGAAQGPTLDLYRNSASPTSGDAIGGVEFNGKDSAGNKQLYAKFVGVIQDAVSGTEDGAIFCQQLVGGALTTIWSTFASGLDIANDLIAHGSVSGGTAAGAMLAGQSDQEAGSATNKLVSPGVQQFHPSAAKWWLKAVVSGGVPSVSVSYNVTSITDTATGRLTVTIGTDFSSSEWVCLTGVQTSSGTIRLTFVNGASAAAGSVELGCVSTVPALADPDVWHAAGYGDQ